MQDLFGSVRRSLVFRSTTDDENQENHPPPFPSLLADKITSCIRKSMVFAKSQSPPNNSTVQIKPPIRWRKGQLIGRGAFGTVYMGMNLDSGELLAVKQVLITSNCASKEKTQAHIQELEEEVKLLKNLSHPNIVRYLGTVREDETLNILLEFVPGGSISSLLEKFGAFPESVVRTYTNQLLLGLEYLHNHAIMHRDIKGANILVDNQGCIKLADFGASKQVAELATISGAKSMKGTPYWMAPEVILQTGHSFSADIWSVGCTVIEMVTGKAPWSQQYKEIAAIFHIGTTKSHPPIPDNISSDANDFLLKCLQQEPNLRPTASELLKVKWSTDIHLLRANRRNLRLKILLHLCQTSTSDDVGDICNLGSLTCTLAFPEKSIQNNSLCLKSNNGYDDDDDNDMCLIDDENFLTYNGETGPSLDNNTDAKKSCDTMSEISDILKCKFDENSGNGETETKVSMEVDHPSYSEDENELTESKIKAFLDDKGHIGRSPSRATDAACCSKSPESGNSSGAPKNSNASAGAEQESNSQSVALSEIERKWKEELDQELERKRREITRQAGMGSSPRDRSLSRHREKSRFASPGK
nr:NPK1-related protein kinase, putative [Arabidopsis thaliana]